MIFFIFIDFNRDIHSIIEKEEKRGVPVVTRKYSRTNDDRLLWRFI